MPALPDRATPLAPDAGVPPAIAPPPPLPQPRGIPVIEAPPRREEATSRERYGAPRPAARTRLSYPEEVIVRVLRLGQSSFAACWRRAQRSDPTLTSLKARLHLRIDPFGVVTAARADLDDAGLATCLSNIGRRLPFPPLGEPVELELPLLF